MPLQRRNGLLPTLLIIVACLSGVSCSRSGYTALPLATGDPSAVAGDSPAAGDAVAQVGDTPPAADPGGDAVATSPVFTAAESALADGTFTIAGVTHTVTISHVRLAYANGHEPVVVVGCDTDIDFFEITRGGTARRLEPSNVPLGRKVRAVMNDDGDVFVVFKNTDDTLGVRRVKPITSEVSAVVTVGAASYDNPNLSAVGTDVVLSAWDTNAHDVALARVHPDATLTVVVQRLDGTALAASTTWEDRVGGYVAGGLGEPRRSTPIYRPTTDTLAVFSTTASTASHDNVYAKARQPLATGGFLAFKGSFTGDGVSASSDPGTDGSADQPYPVLTPDGRLVVATAMQTGGDGRSVAVTLEGSSQFTPLGEAITPLIPAVQPGYGAVTNDSNWDLGVCATDTSVLVLYFDELNSKNVRGALFVAGTGWNSSFFDADRDIDAGTGPGSYDPTLGDERSLSAVFDGQHCYAAWNQQLQTFLVRFATR